MQITKDTLSNTKIRVNTPAESKRVLKLAGQLGYTSPGLQYDDPLYLYFYQDMDMRDGISEGQFQDSKFREITYSDLFPEPCDCKYPRIGPNKEDINCQNCGKDIGPDNWLYPSYLFPEPTRERGEESPCANNWISVEDRLPGYLQSVLIWDADTDGVRWASYCEGDFAGYTCNYDTVTHWQPLPPAPGETPGTEPITPEVLQAEGWEAFEDYQDCDNYYQVYRKGEIYIDFKDYHLFQVRSFILYKGVHNMADLKELERLVNGTK